jgi:hypothetical protein
MRKILLTGFVYCLLMSQSLQAQSYFYNNKYYENAVVAEFGASVGIMNALTDLGGKKGIGKKFIKDLNWKNSKPSFSLYALAMYKYAFAGRIEITFGSIQSADSILKPVAASTFGRYERNLSFKSKITDIQLAMEVHPLFFKDYGNEDPPRISPYAVLGVGYYSFDPQAKLNGNWIALQPLRTEGQGFREYKGTEPYKLKQINVAAGAGVKYEINSLLNARLEIVHRFLSTDYLDDVSTVFIDPSLFANYLPANLATFARQLYNRRGELNPNDATPINDQRGDPRDNDAFFSIQLKVGIALGRQRR